MLKTIGIGICIYIGANIVIGIAYSLTQSYIENKQVEKLHKTIFDSATKIQAINAKEIEFVEIK